MDTNARCDESLADAHLLLKYAHRILLARFGRSCFDCHDAAGQASSGARIPGDGADAS